MYPTWFYARSDMRVRWQSLIALGVIAGLAAGVVLAAWGGSRRSASAIDRFVAATSASSVGGSADLVGDETFAEVVSFPMVAVGSALATTTAVTYPFGYRLGRRSPAAVLRAE